MKLINTINGINYVTMKIFVSGSTDQDKFILKIKKYKGIVCNFKLRGSFFTKKYGIITVLIPESKIMEFNDDELNEV
jgi:hypothetical protein